MLNSPAALPIRAVELDERVRRWRDRHARPIEPLYRRRLGMPLSAVAPHAWQDARDPFHPVRQSDVPAVLLWNGGAFVRANYFSDLALVVAAVPIGRRLAGERVLPRRLPQSGL